MIATTLLGGRTAFLIARRQTLTNYHHVNFKRTLLVTASYWDDSSGPSSRPSKRTSSSLVSSRAQVQDLPTTSSEVDFSDTKKAFHTKTSYELWRTFLLFKILQYDFLVDRSEQLLTLLRRMVGKTLYKRIMKATLFGHFVIGEDAIQAKATLAKLKSQGIYPILAFAKEDDTKQHTNKHSNLIEKACDNNLNYAIDCLNVVADGTSDFPFSATKITALCDMTLLYTWSEALVGSENLFMLLADSSDMLNGRITSDSFVRGAEKMNLGLKESEIDKVWLDMNPSSNGLNFFEWNDCFISEDCDSELYRIFAKIHSSILQARLPIMSEKEKAQMKSVMRRMETLADVAQDRGVRLMVDAEHVFYQPAIRHITVHRLMPKYNLTAPVIYNTQQTYLKKSLPEITRDYMAAQHYGNMFAIKVVRGAYVTHERQQAALEGYEDPIWGTKPETDASYHRVTRFVLEKVKERKAHVMLGTHNEKTIKFVIERINSLGLDRRDGTVMFGQLYGMSDNLTQTLANHRYMVYKYTPYGPVEEVMPYLIRRANENKGMVTGAVRERALIGREIKRRLKQNIIENRSA